MPYSGHDFNHQDRQLIPYDSVLKKLSFSNNTCINLDRGHLYVNEPVEHDNTVQHWAWRLEMSLDF